MRQNSVECDRQSKGRQSQNGSKLGARSNSRKKYVNASQDGTNDSKRKARAVRASSNTGLMPTDSEEENLN